MTGLAWLARASHAVVLSYGWRRAAIAFAAGAVSVLALAPVNAWPVLFVTFPVLVWLVDGASAGRLGGVMSAAVSGWWFGFGYFVAGLYWLGFAFLVDAKTFAWLLPFAVVGLPAGLAIKQEPHRSPVDVGAIALQLTLLQVPGGNHGFTIGEGNFRSLR